MNNFLNKEIPSFMKRNIFYSTLLPLSRENRLVLVLLFNKILYLVKEKKIISELDLSKTVIANCDLLEILSDQNSSEMDVDGQPEHDICVGAPVETSEKKLLFEFGKFVSNDDLNGRQMFILLRILENLLILEFVAETPKIRFVQEFQNVECFQIVESPKFTCRPFVEIEFLSGKTLETNFSKATKVLHGIDNDCQGATLFQDILNTLEHKNRCKISELQTQKLNTRREFESLKSKLLFGKNSSRSQELLEKLPLNRFGDTWIRLSPQGTFYLGIPLIQNYMMNEEESPKKIQNIRVGFQGDFEFTVFDIMNSKKSCFQQFLPNESNFVIILNCKFLEIMKQSARHLPVFVVYDLHLPNGALHSQQFLATNLDISPRFLMDKSLQIVSGTMRNLLTLISTAKRSSFTLKLRKSDVYLKLFDTLEKLKFTKFRDDEIPMSQEFDYEVQEDTYFYCNEESSFWYGMLVSAHMECSEYGQFNIYTDFECKVLALLDVLTDTLFDKMEVVSENEDGEQMTFEELNNFRRITREQPSTSRD